MIKDGRWDEVYSKIDRKFKYGDNISYEIGASWLKSCKNVEDWGCGGGWFSEVCPTNVIGVDGSNSIFADRVCDLTQYTSNVEGIFMRHVLEHNIEWYKILKNLMSSFTERAFISVFTPFTFGDSSILLKENEGSFKGIPDLALPMDLFMSQISNYIVEYNMITSKSIYGVEYLFKLEVPK